MVRVARLAGTAQLAAILAGPDSAIDFICPEDFTSGKHDTVDLGEEWHATHFQQTGSPSGTASPLSLIMGDFAEVGEDVGYGPATCIAAEQLAAFHTAAVALDEAELRRRYDVDAMMRDHVFVADALCDEGDEALGFVLARVTPLRDFAARGVANRCGAFAVIT